MCLLGAIVCALMHNWIAMAWALVACLWAMSWAGARMRAAAMYHMVDKSLEAMKELEKGLTEVVNEMEKHEKSAQATTGTPAPEVAVPAASTEEKKV